MRKEECKLIPQDGETNEPEGSVAGMDKGDTPLLQGKNEKDTGMGQENRVGMEVGSD